MQGFLALHHVVVSYVMVYNSAERCHCREIGIITACVRGMYDPSCVNYIFNHPILPELKEEMGLCSRSVFGMEPSQMSFLFFLMYAAAAGGLLPLLENTPGSAQELKIKVHSSYPSPESIFLTWAPSLNQRSYFFSTLMKLWLLNAVCTSWSRPVAASIMPFFVWMHHRLGRHKRLHLWPCMGFCYFLCPPSAWTLWLCNVLFFVVLRLYLV